MRDISSTAAGLKAWLGACALLGLAACQAMEDSPGEGSGVRKSDEVRQIGHAGADSLEAVSDPFRLDSAGLEGDSLVVWISFAGGCRKHLLTAYLSEYTYLSLPSGKDFWVHHESHGDACEAYLHARMAFEAKAVGLAQPGNFLLVNRHSSDAGEPVRVTLPVKIAR